jgi:hypothetical protein
MSIPSTTILGGDLTYQHHNGWSIFQLTLPTWADQAPGS